MPTPLRLAQLGVCLLLIGCSRPKPTEAPAPHQPEETAESAVQAAPDPIPGVRPLLLVPLALNLIIEQEVTSQTAYNRLYIHPTDGGGGASGVTTGIGYDYSAVSQRKAVEDWTDLPDDDNRRLAATAGLSGPPARSRLPGLKDISVPWGIAVNEFQVVDVPRYWKECEDAFPGFDDLRPNAQGAVLSVVYNRGSSTVGPSRVDFIALRSAIAKQDYGAMADAVRHMLVTMRAAWQAAGIYDGMLERRDAEALLIVTP